MGPLQNLGVSHLNGGVLVLFGVEACVRVLQFGSFGLEQGDSILARLREINCREFYKAKLTTEPRFSIFVT